MISHYNRQESKVTSIPYIYIFKNYLKLSYFHALCLNTVKKTVAVNKGPLRFYLVTSFFVRFLYQHAG
jgi:hypothetical protein